MVTTSIILLKNIRIIHFCCCLSLLLVISLAAKDGSKASTSDKSDHHDLLLEAVHSFDHQIDQLLLERANGKQQSVDIVAKVKKFFNELDEFMSKPGAGVIFDTDVVMKAKSATCSEEIHAFWEEQEKSKFQEISHALQNIKLVKGKNAQDEDIAKAMKDLQKKIKTFVAMLRVKIIFAPREEIGTEISKISAEFQPSVVEAIIKAKVKGIWKKQRNDIAHQEKKLKWRHYQLLLQASMKLLNMLESSKQEQQMEARTLVQRIVKPIFMEIREKYKDAAAKMITEQKFQEQLNAAIIKEKGGNKKKHAAAPSENEAKLFASRIRSSAAKVLALYDTAWILLSSYSIKMEQAMEDRMTLAVCQQLKESLPPMDWPQALVVCGDPTGQ